MNEDIIALYQEALGLLRFRNPNLTLSGTFDYNSDGSVCFELQCIGEHGIKKHKFKVMEDTTKALKYFIKTSQNLFNLV